jgi:hypothetical protein
MLVLVLVLVLRVVCGLEKEEGEPVMNDRGECFGFEVLFLSFFFALSRFPLLSFSMLLIHLGFLWFISFYFLCVRCFGSFSIWWSICCVVHSFVHSFVSVGVPRPAAGLNVSVNPLLFDSDLLPFLLDFFFFVILWFSIVRLRFLSSGLMPVQFFVSTSFSSVLLSSPLPLPLSFFFHLYLFHSSLHAFVMPCSDSLLYQDDSTSEPVMGVNVAAERGIHPRHQQRPQERL